MDPKEKLITKIREETPPIEVNVQSAGVAEKEQVFFTEDDAETVAQFRERKNKTASFQSTTRSFFKLTQNLKT